MLVNIHVIFKGILGELNKEQETFLKDKKDSEVAAVPPWVGHPNEEAVKAECLGLSTVSNYCTIVQNLEVNNFNRDFCFFYIMF